jgi:hypothetical protein
MAIMYNEKSRMDQGEYFFFESNEDGAEVLSPPVEPVDNLINGVLAVQKGQEAVRR